MFSCIDLNYSLLLVLQISSVDHTLILIAISTCLVTAAMTTQMRHTSTFIILVYNTCGSKSIYFWFGNTLTREWHYPPGSTWLFNAVRLLFKHAKCPLDSYWMHNITDAKLKARGLGKSNLLIKTHHWSEDWNTESATHIFLTHRDLKDVIASYERMGWRFGPLPNSYVSEHLQWKVRIHTFGVKFILMTKLISPA